MDSQQNEVYMRAYMAGYTEALKKKSESPPYIDKEGIIARYDGKIGTAKAYQILQGVRHVCNGGKLNSASMVLVSELEYWESLVDAQYKERL